MNEKYQMKRDEVNMNNSVKWSRFIVPKKIEQIIDYLLIDTYLQVK
jgi:hypothetical protein